MVCMPAVLCFKEEQAKAQVEQKAQEEAAASLQQLSHETGQPLDGDEEVVDIDLNDPEVAAAATRIQAGFKGYMVRKHGKEEPAQEVRTSDIRTLCLYVIKHI